ncbi:hypothetical protein YA62_010160 [Agrobacterium sp. LC34]|uniref:hypothetical protein n=1 Tax=Agrobacterium sp. LC34 TaxID=1643810 RepID=UPI000629FEE1|nr:hypothetical protein [Agrobacterium sp. LC34]TKT65851.1 hypothetical protein YA62_010160 [Agrobacterium sp. LC34]
MFDGAKLKLSWANRHIKDLNTILNDFVASDFYTLKNEFDSTVGFYQITFQTKKEPPPFIPLLIGDAIHNLRVALDHAAAEIVGVDNAGISFPFHELRQNHIDANGTLLGHAKTIERAKQGFGYFILNEIRPYADGDGNKLLWSLSKLDNVDKHRLLIPVLAITSVDVHDLYDKVNHITISHLRGEVDPNGFIDLVGSDNHFEIRGEIQPGFTVLFGDGTYFDNNPVIKTLVEISNAVLKALRQLEEFVLNGVSVSQQN